MKVIKIIFVIIFFPSILLCQIINEKIFYDSKWQVCDSIKAEFTETYYFKSNKSKSGYSTTYNNLGILISSKEYSNLKEKVKSGKSIHYFDNGKIKWIHEYKNGKLHGPYVSYYLSGILKRREYYKKDKLVSGNCYTSLGEDTTYFNNEIMPQFPGGESEMYSFISKNIVYPEEKITKGISGRVFLKFIIDDNGYVKDAKITRSLHPILDKAALDAINKMPKWQPGYQDGIPVNVTYNMPIRFTIK